jgi:hypothetical protein
MQILMTHINNRAIRLISLVLILALVISIIGPGKVQADSGWYNANWLFRKKITINSDNVSGDLSEFPVLISITDGDLADHALDNGYDILFTEDDKVSKLSHEIESFNGTSGNLKAWVRIPSLASASDTEIYMYYGYPGANNQENATGVWDTDYKMVQHLEETSGGANAITDSTSYNNDGSDDNTLTYGATGQVDGAIGFNGSDDYIDCGSAGSLDMGTSNFTAEAWIKTDTNTFQIVIQKSNKLAYADTPGYGFYLRTSNPYVKIWVSDGTTLVELDSCSFDPKDGNWHYIVHVFDSSTDNATLYIDGSFISNKIAATAMGSIDSTRPLEIGRDYANNVPRYYFDGTIDEVRVSNKARSTDWIQTSYNNQMYPDDFITLSSQEVRGAPTVIGGLVLPVNKATVLAPWLCLGAILSLVIVRIIFHFRKRRGSRHY